MKSIFIEADNLFTQKRARTRGVVANMPRIRTEICDICNKSVLDDHQALLCDKCNIWKHRECLTMSQKTYQKLSKSKEEWLCSSCISAKDASNHPQGKNYTLADVMAKLEEMDMKYKSLFTKYNEQIKVNEKLQEEISQIKRQLNKNEQKDLKNNLLVQGVPYKENENVPEIINKIGTYLGVKNDNKFTAFRLGKDNSKANVIKVIFEDETTKTKFLKSKKKFEIKSTDLGHTKESKIFLNHELTNTNFDLFMAARTFKKDHNYKFLWIGNGNIFLRKDEHSKILLLEEKSQLEN